MATNTSAYIPTGVRITSPGKFEGELDFVPFMWNQAMMGFVQDVGEYYFVTLDAIGAKHSSLYGAALREDSNGFIHSVWYESLEDFSCAVTEMERFEELAGEDSEDY